MTTACRSATNEQQLNRLFELRDTLTRAKGDGEGQCKRQLNERLSVLSGAPVP